MLVQRRLPRVFNWHAAATLVALGQAVALWSNHARAGESPDAVLEKAHWLEQRGRIEEAGELLQRVAASQPNNETLAVARAEAYHLDKNPFWALKVLGEYLAQHPDACDARAYAARIHLEEANLDQAEQTLDAPVCAQREAMRLRFLLLRAELAELRAQRARAAENIEFARRIHERYAEDDARLARLSAKYDPYHQPAVTLRLDVGAGWASQATGALPLDVPTSPYRDASAMLGLDLSGRIMPQAKGDARAFFDFELHLARYLETPAKDLSYEQPIIRGGLLFGRGKQRFSVALAADWVHLDLKVNPTVDDTSLYSLGQRLELGFELAQSIQTYAHFGRRAFWARDRDRLENELGIAKAWAISDTLNLTTGVESRLYKAEGRAFDQIGGTLHARLDIGMPKQFTLRESIAFADDRFPRSAGFFDANRRRHDRLLRVGARLESPRWLGITWGLSYGYAYRDSTASNYDFSDHRVMAFASWRTDSESVMVKSIPKAGRVPMPYPDDATQPSKTQAEVVEVIRQDQVQQQNGSCLK